MNTEGIAADFAARWTRSWNSEGPVATAQLYTSDSMLVGGALAIGRDAIGKALAGLFNQGWTRIEIAVVHAQAQGEVVLVASTFTAHGSGANAGKTLAGKSTHALTRVDGVWLSAMHTAA
ncbi:MAG TPA: nuclear transport factor 2 family protein [Dongiaceae bacterium]|nr:nuclear transport factor 2 family protein [Dongiaceae bacterium]